MAARVWVDPQKESIKCMSLWYDLKWTHTIHDRRSYALICLPEHDWMTNTHCLWVRKIVLLLCLVFRLRCAFVRVCVVFLFCMLCNSVPSSKMSNRIDCINKFYAVSNTIVSFMQDIQWTFEITVSVMGEYIHFIHMLISNLLLMYWKGNIRAVNVATAQIIKLTTVSITEVHKKWSENYSKSQFA